MEALTPEAQRKVEAYIPEQRTEPSSTRHIDVETVKLAADRIFAEHHELFRKLAD